MTSSASGGGPVYPAGQGALYLAAGDGDGKAGISVANPGVGSVNVLLDTCLS